MADYVLGREGDDQLAGGIGNDILVGEQGEDQLAGDSGNDILVGGIGSDTYIFGRCDGSDLIYNNNGNESAQGHDTIFLKNDIDLNQTYLLKTNHLEIITANGKIRIVNHFNLPPNGANIHSITLANGRVLNATEIEAATRYDSLATYLNNDILVPPVTEVLDGEAQTVRFLNITTYGADYNSVKSLAGGDINDWVKSQIDLPFSSSHYEDYVRANSNGSNLSIQDSIWWIQAMQEDAQLRERVAFALSQIFVISSRTYLTQNAGFMTASYYDMLRTHAFGNLRDILEEVTYSPIMGIYLSSKYNEKANGNIRPDENYARELLQLFSTGLNKLNLDGTLITESNGDPIPVYNPDDIQTHARIFTGLSPAGARYWKDTSPSHPNPVQRMVTFDEHHDQAEKILFDGTILPAGQTTNKDITQTLDRIFDHPNVAPFIGKQLIQRLVTSNPSNEYVARISQVFNDNSNGIKGDLSAVIMAILTDTEALKVYNGELASKAKEPILVATQILRGLNAITDNKGGYSGSSSGSIGNVSAAYNIGQAYLGAPSVFNFYPFAYQPSGELSEQGLLSPELFLYADNQILNMFKGIRSLNRISTTADGDYADKAKLNYGELTMLLRDKGANTVIKRLNLLFAYNKANEATLNAMQTHLQQSIGKSERQQRIAIGEVITAFLTSAIFWTQ